jgi:ureidoglycolate dehydrogenase (NAD+)
MAEGGQRRATDQEPIQLDEWSLRRAMEKTLIDADVPPDDAALAVETLLRGEREGATGHGLVRFPMMVRRLRAGLTNPRPELRRVRQTVASAVLDGDNGLGQVVLHRAMAVAVEKARAAGVGFVTVRDSNHAGRIGDAALDGAEQGCLALVGSNASPRLVSGPGARRLLGNNPLACAAPGSEHPFVLDLSPGNTTVGSIRLAALEGRPLPEGVALDREGNPTTDAADGLAGGMLGVGGHKGWVLALLVDVLAGVLSEGAIADEVGATQDLSKIQRVSHFMLAIDLAAVLPAGAFERRLDELRVKVAGAGGDAARLPGDRRADLPRTDSLRVSVELCAALDEVLDRRTRPRPSGA